MNNFLSKMMAACLLFLFTGMMQMSANVENSSVQQGIQITGNINDETGETLPGVNITVKGTTTGTTSDVNGRFSITVPSQDAVLVFSFVGYATRELAVGNQRNINVTLSEETSQIEEVVVIGYGVQRRANLSGAVSTVNAEALESRPVTDPISALQGAVPGMVISRLSGQPGNEEFSMSIRGRSSTRSSSGSNDPLVIIDGVSGNLGSLNPEDIESISVLKDAQAAIYGARAANGVILVTTKKGAQGIPRIRYNGNVAITKMAGMMELTNFYEYAIMDNEANVHNNGTPLWSEDYLQRILRSDPSVVTHPGRTGQTLLFQTTDWKDALIRNGFQQRHNLSVSGGGQNSNYFLSAGYSNQQGVIKYSDDGNTRYNLRMNYDYTFFNRIKLETRMSVENSDRREIGGVSSANLISYNMHALPFHPIYTPDGQWFSEGGWINSVAIAKDAATRHDKTNRINTNFRLITDIFDGLKLYLQAGLNQTNYNRNDPRKHVQTYSYYGVPQSATHVVSTPEQSALYLRNEVTRYRNYTGYLQYSKKFGKHNIDLMAGLSHEESDNDWFEASRDGFTYEDMWALRLGRTTNLNNDGAGSHWSIRSVFGRAGYTFANKYIFEANFRYDGSSRFSGSESRWGFFPAASVAWRIGQEEFLRNLGIFDELKLRLSYGETGNQLGLGLHDYIQKLTLRTFGTGSGDLHFGFDGPFSRSMRLDGMVSYDRTWETLVNQNVGIDATVLKNRLNFTFDYFVKRNKDMLIPVTYPALLGATAPTTNSGELKSWGFELSAGWQDKIGPVSYFVRAMLSDAQNKIVRYDGQDTYVLGLNSIREGYPVDSYFLYQFDGLIRNQTELDEYKKLKGIPSNIGIGDARIKNKNGDDEISTYGNNDGDAIFAGDRSPRYIYGLTFGGRAYGFDLSVFFQGVGKRTILREGDYRRPGSADRLMPRFYYNETWHETRQNAYYPKLSYGSIRDWNYGNSTIAKVNAAYIRLKNVQFGYTIPRQLVQKIHIDRARIYFSGMDLWEHHNVKGGWDPESNYSGNNYPFQRYYSFGLDLTF